MAIIDMEFHEIRKIKLSLGALSVFRGIANDKVMNHLYRLLDRLEGRNNDLSAVIGLYNVFFNLLASSQPACSLQDYLFEKIFTDENSFSRRAETTPFVHIPAVLRASAAQDLNHLQTVSELSPLKIKAYIIKLFTTVKYEVDIVEKLPVWAAENTGETSGLSGPEDWKALRKLFFSGSHWSQALEALSDFYYKNGCGPFARYKAFVWESTGASGRIRGVENPDPVRFTDLIGYEVERSEVVENTLQFLQNFPANNLLLYGDRGTGKSTTVKALLNEYHALGLRLVEVPKKHLIDFSRIIRQLGGRRLKFILFVDDLAFEDNEESYTALKAVLEGSLESRPDNLLIYATSNRRHLVKEKFSDRSGLSSGNSDDEVRAADTLQEKLSLADRFGITVVFSAPDKYKYLEIVEGLARQRGLPVDKEVLHKEAMKWELYYNGRSPRTAKQFVDWLEGELKKRQPD